MKAKETVHFENSLHKLEELVEKLESGDLGLDDSLKLFEEGVQLYKKCKDKLVATEKKLALLTEQMNEESLDFEE